MAILTSNVLTLADWAKRQDPNGKMAVIIELLSQTNDVLDDIPWKESNEVTGHRTTIRSGLPTVYWKQINKGVQPSKSTTAQITESVGTLEAWSEVPVDVAKLNGDVAQFRLSESMPFLEAMRQEAAQTIFYGNSNVDPEEFSGLSIRYSSTSAENGRNVISGSGVGSDNSSIWLIGWGESMVHGIYPKGSNIGLEHNDYGEETVESTSGIGGTRDRAYRERWAWKMGLVLKDWRYAVRICNLDASNLASKSGAADLVELMIKAVHKIQNLNNCKPVFYMNRTCFSALDIQRRDDVISGGGLTYIDVDGKAIPTFRGIRISLCDALTVTEATVS